MKDFYEPDLERFKRRYDAGELNEEQILRGRRPTYDALAKEQEAIKARRHAARIRAASVRTAAEQKEADRRKEVARKRRALAAQEKKARAQYSAAWDRQDNWTSKEPAK